MGKREGINYPKFKDQFAAMDFDADPMPVLSLFPLPSPRKLEEWKLLLTDVDGKRMGIGWSDLERLPRVNKRAPLVCQIFNWCEAPQIEGVVAALPPVEALTADPKVPASQGCVPPVGLVVVHPVKS